MEQLKHITTAEAAAQKPRLLVIKIGGNVIDDETKLTVFLNHFAALLAPFGEGSIAKILVHGGGASATKLAEQMGVPQQMVNGRRITDAATLKIVTMVYAGYINKNIVAQLAAAQCAAVGICGADGNAVLAHKRRAPASSPIDGVSPVDYGFAGDVDAVNAGFISALLKQKMALVVSPITHDNAGQLLNTNADTIAQEIAKAMSAEYDVQLIYCFEKAGVLLDAADEASVIPELNQARYQTLKTENKVFAGMLPKLDNAFAALQCGVKKVTIGKAENLAEMVAGKGGTSILP